MVYQIVLLLVTDGPHSRLSSIITALSSQLNMLIVQMLIPKTSLVCCVLPMPLLVPSLVASLVPPVLPSADGLLVYPSVALLGYNISESSPKCDFSLFILIFIDFCQNQYFLSFILYKNPFKTIFLLNLVKLLVRVTQHYCNTISLYLTAF